LQKGPGFLAKRSRGLLEKDPEFFAKKIAVWKKVLGILAKKIPGTVSTFARP
jgi:hypothetical protein